MNKKWIMVGVLAGCILGVVVATAQAQGKFTDVTESSGIGKIVRDKQATGEKWWMTGIFLGDLDNDGSLDFVISAHGAGGALVSLNDGKGHFKVAGNQPFKSEVHVACDADEDGKLDMTMTYQDGGAQWWINQSTPGELKFAATRITRGTNTSRIQAMIDLDRDGKVDWIRNPERRGIVLDAGDGKGGFTEKGKIAGLPSGDFLAVDLDGDGFLDMLCVYSGGYTDKPGKSRVYHNDGKNNFTDVTKESGIPEEGVCIKGFGDFNQDGSPDVMVLDHLKSLDLYFNDGKGHFTKKEGALQMPGMSAAYGSWGICVVTDFDNDGIADIITNGKHYLKVFRGLGGGNFEYMNQKWGGIKDIDPANVDEGLCFGDIDNDGMLDIIGYTANDDPKHLAVYHNDLPRQNYVRVRPIGLPGNKGAAGAKIRITEPGTQAGGGKLLWYEPVSIFCKQAVQSYYGSAITERHFGLGQRATVDVSVEFYPSGKKVERKGVKADSTMIIDESSK